jgi:uncharacterized protein
VTVLLSAPVLVTVGAALLAGLARGFSGFGAALIFIPLAGAAIGPRAAAPVLLVVDAVLTLAMVPNAWRLAERREVAVLLLGALVGVPVGAALLATSDPLIVRWAVVALVLVLLAFLISGARLARAAPAPAAVGVGAAAGFFSGLAQMGGPPVVAYWLGRALPGATVRANLIVYFALSSALSFVSYVGAGLITGEVVLLTVATTPAYAAGLFLGARLFHRASEATFRRLCYALIAAAAILSMPVLDGILR